MYVVGFYSPRQKSGVTEMALSVTRYLREEKKLSVAFVSNGILQNEPLSDGTIDRFATLPTRRQKQMLKKLKRVHDMVIYDVSTPDFSDQILELLPLADRVFVLKDDDTKFQELLYSILAFNKQFHPKTKDMVKYIHNDGYYLLPKEDRIGFTSPSDRNVKMTGEIIFQHYQIYKLHVYYVTRFNEIKKKLLNPPPELSLSQLAYENGLDFPKALLLELYVSLRKINGQPYPDIIDDLFPLFIQGNFSSLLEQFEQERALTGLRVSLNSNE
ncbi:hypothetical protein [Ammoniphilus resinae]|uniref:Uncharacterized protein n=1 Tax=Ammoniphilus resinae TaxID=861532 RepID=A0ABS4GL06_9BACL|nr:hypothetical protein [Ammoniphilus resinae]MBP1930950.1 hypothetical protein [Ammoniphilus resinae]